MVDGSCAILLEIQRTLMCIFKVTSKQVTQNLITIEMSESVAKRVSQSIETDLLNYGDRYDPKDVEEMQKLSDAIREHLQ